MYIPSRDSQAGGVDWVVDAEWQRPDGSLAPLPALTSVGAKRVRPGPEVLDLTGDV
jgi:hypothetical protein